MATSLRLSCPHPAPRNYNMNPWVCTVSSLLCKNFKKRVNKKKHLCQRQEQISLLQSSSTEQILFFKQMPICLSNLSHIFGRFLLCFIRAAAHAHLDKQFAYVSKPAWSIFFFFFLIVVYSVQFFYSWAISSKIKESHSKLFCFLMTQAFLRIHFWSHHPMWPAAKWK